MWDLWWTKRHWGWFSQSISVFPAKQSIECSTMIITQHPPSSFSSAVGTVDLNNSELGFTSHQEIKEKKLFDSSFVIGDAQHVVTCME
jgi:hypothetical protein